MLDVGEISKWEREVISWGYSEDLPWGNDGGGIGGDMGELVSDFEVTEIPAYLPSGSGEHVYLWIEKVELTTLEVFRRIEEAFGVREIDVGYAGKKDVRARTRQWYSVRFAGDPSEGVSALSQTPGLRVLEATRHHNKLRMGHLKGNRFRVNLYGVREGAAVIESQCRRLSEEGFINYFGKQRFGYEFGNVSRGIGVLRGEFARHQMKKLYVSALQSAVFNLYAGRRIAEKGYEVCKGDVLQKLGAGCFICMDPETDDVRARQGEVVVTGALPGRKVMQGSGYTADLERRCVRDFGLRPEGESAGGDDFEGAKKFGEGARRALWVRPEDLLFERCSEDRMTVEFSLPSGSYATVLLRHLCGSTFSR